MTIREARADDLEALVALNAEIQTLHHQALPQLFKPAAAEPAKAYFAALMGEAANRFLLANADEAVAGYLFCERRERPETALTYASRALYIHHLGVRPGYRRQGIGRGLMAAARSLAAETACGRIEVDFWAFNDAARDFYAALGFVSCNERWWQETRA